MRMICPQCGNIWKGKKQEHCPLHPNIVGIEYVNKKVYRSKVEFGMPVAMSERNHGYYSSSSMGGKVLAHKANNQ